MHSITAKSRRLLSLFSLFFIAVLFQNCDYISEGLLTDTSTRDQASADAMPFAFDINIDHIAYMSCRGESFSKRQQSPFFTFKAGGYQSGTGVGLRDSFLRRYGGFAKRRLSELLSLSKRNRETGVVMSIRETGQFQNIVRFELNSNEDNAESLRGDSMDGLMFDPEQAFTLTSSSVLSLLLNQRNSQLNYLKGLSVQRELKTFDGRISLFSKDDDQRANEIPTPPPNSADRIYRDLLEDQAYLAFTFATEEKDPGKLGLRARSPFTPTGETAEGNRSVWGKGYQFNFSGYDNYVSTGFRPSSQKRALVRVRAYDLETEASLNETWLCPDDQKYVIVRRQDAIRRYDGVSIGSINHPFNGYDRMDHEDFSSGLDLMTTYNDGGPALGGHYYTYQADYDGNGELDYVRHKVICPLVADQVPANTIENQAEREAWDRIRQVLPVEDWYVFRGKYNCIVPKNATGDLCYARGGNFNDGLDETDARNLVQYFANEDHPDIRIDQERRDLADPGSEIEEIRLTLDCGPSSSVSHGGRNYCPHVLSLCYRIN